MSDDEESEIESEEEWTNDHANALCLLARVSRSNSTDTTIHSLAASRRSQPREIEEDSWCASTATVVSG